MQKYILYGLLYLLPITCHACGTSQDTMPVENHHLLGVRDVRIVIICEDKKTQYRLSVSKRSESKCYANQQGCQTLDFHEAPYDLVAISATTQDSSMPFFASLQDVQGKKTIIFTVKHNSIDIEKK